MKMYEKTLDKRIEPLEAKKEQVGIAEIDRHFKIGDLEIKVD